MKSVALVLAVVGLAAGCATTSPIAPAGKDTYYLNAEDIWGVYSSGSLKAKALQEANAFCQSQGKVMRIRNTNDQGVQMWTGTSSSLLFSCIPETDAENTRPNLLPAPAVTIEDRRK